MNLFNLSTSYVEVMNMLENEEVTFKDVKDTLDSIESSFEDKADNIQKLIQSINADIEYLKAEKKRINDRKKQFEDKAASLKQYLFDAMKYTGKTKFKTPLFSYSIQNTAKQLNKETLNVTSLPRCYFITQEPKLDTTKLTNDLREGIAIAGAELYQPESLVIK